MKHRHISKPDDRMNTEPSLHLRTPVVGVDGKPKRVFMSSEAAWKLVPKLCVVAEGSALITKPGQHGPTHGQAMPVPFWEIIQINAETKRGAAWIVPLHDASERIPVGLVERTTSQGTRIDVVPLVAIEQAKAEEKQLVDAGLVRAEH
ncbi:MAG: hypothetical protein AB7T06_29220 [Kofleriaceae bacterium]